MAFGDSGGFTYYRFGDDFKYSMAAGKLFEMKERSMFVTPGFVYRRNDDADGQE